jgi:hypothetical protein
MQPRNSVWLLSLTVLGASAFGYALVTPSFDAPGGPRFLFFILMGIAGLLSVFLFPQFKSRSTAVWAIWIPAIVLRLLLLPTAPSDDVNRYLWEGQLVREGVSPYAQTADSDSVSQYRDQYWEAMNHKGQATAYPPLAELIFAAVGAVSYQPLAYKLFFVLADLMTLAGVLHLLRGRGLGIQYSGFYALCPAILVSYAGEAHFDSLMVALLVWALCAFESGRTKLALVLASLATGVKCITLPLIPFFAGKRLLVGAVLSLATLLLPGLLFWDSLAALSMGLFQFGGTSSFNGPVYDLLLLGLDLPRGVCSGVVALAFAGLLLWRWICREHDALDCHIRWILGALIVLSPTVHFWYLAWILPFVCLRPSLPWITFSVTAGAYFFVWTNAATGSGWSLELWQQGLFWVPFFIACIYELWSTRGAVVWGHRRSADPAHPSVAVVIPTLNAAAYLPQALASIDAQTHSVDAVLVVDAGSEDESVSIAERAELPVQVLSSEPGRGLQIAAGIEASNADWVFVLHADAELASDAVECVLRAVDRCPRVIGGAMGQRFMETNAALLPIEVLNDVRALFSRTAFGDQVQFFHRATAVRYELMPQQPLMEDVESSWRTRELGGFLYLGKPCRVSHQKWDAKDWFTRVKLVMRLVSRYRFARLRGRAQAEKLSQQCYQEYYPDRK